MKPPVRAEIPFGLIMLSLFIGLCMGFAIGWFIQ